MPFIKFTEQEKESANASSIVDYLTTHGESVKRSGREYVWDSPSGKVTIHGSEWYSQYEQVGGGAVNFVRKFYGMSYPEAVRSLLGSGVGTELIPHKKENRVKEKVPFALPERNEDMRRVYAYLTKERFIDRDVLTRFVREGLIYEEAGYHNVVFVGKDLNGTPVHAQKRSTIPMSDFKGNLDSSVAEYSFHWVGNTDKLFIFEAPIDMLAFISLNKNGWENHSYVALCSTADRAAMQMLRNRPNLKTVYLCLDHDSAGIRGCYRVAESIHALGDYSVWRRSPKNKDWDEDLKALNGKEAIPSSEEPKLEYVKGILAEMKNYSPTDDPDNETFDRYPGDIIEDGMVRLQRQYQCEDYLEMARTCLSVCYYRDRLVGNEQEITAYTDRLMKLYKPHHDTESVQVLTEELGKSLAGIKSELTKCDALTVSRIASQNETLLSFALDCIRTSGAVDQYIIPEQKPMFVLTM